MLRYGRAGHRRAGVVIFGALVPMCGANLHRERRQSRIGYSFLLALRAPVAALIGFLIAGCDPRRLPGGGSSSSRCG